MVCACLFLPVGCLCCKHVVVLSCAAVRCACCRLTSVHQPATSNQFVVTARTAPNENSKEHSIKHSNILRAMEGEYNEGYNKDQPGVCYSLTGTHVVPGEH